MDALQNPVLIGVIKAFSILYEIAISLSELEPDKATECCKMRFNWLY
jgi:hypothetical protein